MALCSACGAELSAGARFCSVCGAEVSTVAASTATGDYDLVLLTIGTCPQTQADDVLQDLLGYSELEAFELLTVLPAQVAYNLTETQALYLAQALTEYGMDVAVYRGATPVELGAKATASVYQSDGSILKSVLATLATVTIANRLTKFLRWERAVPQRAYFVVSAGTGEMRKRYGFVYVDKDNDGAGTLARSKKGSFAYYRHIIDTNGEEL